MACESPQTGVQQEEMPQSDASQLEAKPVRGVAVPSTDEVQYQEKAFADPESISDNKSTADTNYEEQRENQQEKEECASRLRTLEELEDDLLGRYYRNRFSMETFLNNERHHGRLYVRSQMAKLNYEFTLSRIDLIEKQLHDVRAIVFKDDEEFKSPPRNRARLPIHKHELRRSAKADFRLTRESVFVPTTEQAALEVLISESTLTSGSVGQMEVTTTLDPIALQKSHPLSTGAAIEVTRGTLRATPERVRIRSRSLMYHLQNLTKIPILSVTGSQNGPEGKVYSSVVFLRPFKFFIKYETTIRNSMEKLEALGPKRKFQRQSSNSEHENNDLDLLGMEQEKFDYDDLIQDMRLLIHFMNVDLRPTFDLRQHIQNDTAIEIEYADLWHLFKRGEMVITRNNQTNAYLVINVARGREPLIHKAPSDEKITPVEGFAVDCISIGTDGSYYVPRLEKLSIRKYKGAQRISSLPVYPLRLDPNADSLMARFREGGRQFLNVTRDPFCHKTVRGMTQDEPSHKLDTQVIIDMTLAMSEHPQWRIPATVSTKDLTDQDIRETREKYWCGHTSDTYDSYCCGSDVIFRDLEQDSLELEEFMRDSSRHLGPQGSEDITEMDLPLLRPNVHAFVLRSRQWVTVRTADLHNVVFRNNFNDLLLPDEHRTTVQALVKTHENTRMSQSSGQGTSIGSALELVKGKGSGLIILLHGPPGVGKTSTAECVADDTRRPLYPITCGDIGETAVDVERHLQHNFKLAHKWGCVLLLDEADVFLARRTKNNLSHNAVTSVFLRSLEYYAGILFLTTNRVGAIDPAFKSRIRMSLFYPKLDIDVTCKLYEKYIKRVQDKQDATGQRLFNVKKKEILRFAKKHFRTLKKEQRDTWNGRQIHNAFQTAIALAEHESMTSGSDDPKPVLGKSQFDTVANGFRKFDEYLVMTWRETEADAAKREGVRDDSFISTAAGNMATPMTPLGAMSKPAHGVPAGNLYSQMTVHSESDEDSELDSDEDEDEDENQQKSRAGKAAATVTTSSSNDMEEFQEYLKWKKMRS